MSCPCPFKGNRAIPVSIDQFPLLQRNALLELFTRYNTPIPSSAAVEGLFSVGQIFLDPRDPL
jgi:hypothetical protein